MQCVKGHANQQYVSVQPATVSCRVKRASGLTLPFFVRAVVGFGKKKGPNSNQV